MSKYIQVPNHSLRRLESLKIQKSKSLSLMPIKLKWFLKYAIFLLIFKNLVNYFDLK